MIAKTSMRLLAAAWGLTLVACLPSLAQSTHQGDAAATYQWVHTNAQPGDCGCFGLNGGGVSASMGFAPHLAAVVEVSGGFEGTGSSTGNTLTLVSYLGGPRFYLGTDNPFARYHLEPFAQVLLGEAHAGGGVAGAGDGTYAFAMRAGGGFDLPVSRNFVIRLLQIDYYLTDFANTTNNHQNNFLIGAGAVVRWSY